MSDFLGKLVYSLKSVVGYGNKDFSFYWKLLLYKENGVVNGICASMGCLIELFNLPVNLEGSHAVYNFLTEAWEDSVFPLEIGFLKEKAKNQQAFSHQVIFRRKEIGEFMEQTFAPPVEKEKKDPGLSEIKFRVIFSSPIPDTDGGKLIALKFKNENGRMVARESGLTFVIDSRYSSTLQEYQIIPVVKYICAPVYMDQQTVFVQVLRPWSDVTATIIDSREKCYNPKKIEFLPHLTFPCKSVKPLFSMDQRFEKVITETHVDGGFFMLATRAFSLTDSGAININFTLNPMHPVMIWDQGNGMEVRITLGTLLQNTGDQWR